MTDQLQFNNQPVNYRVQGNGPWVILLHGFLESIEIWNELANVLSDEFSVLMIDLPGHGRSGLEGEEQPLPLMAAAVRAVIAHLSIDDFILCGHSMGGYVSLEIAHELPDRTKGLILFHSHAAPDDEQAKENRTRTINIVRLNHSNFIVQFVSELFAPSNVERLSDKIERFRNRAASTSGKAIIAALKAMREREGSLDIIINASFPVFFIIGKDDSKMPYQKLMAQAMLANHVEILSLSNVGHMGFIEAPDVIFPAIRHFCQRYLIVPMKLPGFGD